MKSITLDYFSENRLKEMGRRALDPAKKLTGKAAGGLAAGAGAGAGAYIGWKGAKKAGNKFKELEQSGKIDDFKDKVKSSFKKTVNKVKDEFND